MRARILVLAGGVLMALTVSSAARADDATTVGAVPPPVNTQVTDVLTSGGAFMNGAAPALAFGGTTIADALSLGPEYNNSPEAVAHAFTLDEEQIEVLLQPHLADARLTDQTRREVSGIAELAQDCDDRCVINVQVHVKDGAALTQEIRRAVLAAASALALALADEAGEEVPAIGWVIPDGDRGDTDSGGDQPPTSTGTLVTSIDVLLQRDIDTANGSLSAANPDRCALKPYAICSYMNLDDLDFTGMDLTGIDFTGASLTRTRMDRASLGWASFAGAYLPNASFAGADLRAANLRNAWIPRVDFAGANLQRANLLGAEITDKSFASNADLSSAIWWNGVTCLPKSIGTCRQQ